MLPCVPERPRKQWLNHLPPWVLESEAMQPKRGSEKTAATAMHIIQTMANAGTVDDAGNIIDIWGGKNLTLGIKRGQTNDRSLCRPLHRARRSRAACSRRRPSPAPAAQRKCEQHLRHPRVSWESRRLTRPSTRPTHGAQRQARPAGPASVCAAHSRPGVADSALAAATVRRGTSRLAMHLARQRDKPAPAGV